MRVSSPMTPSLSGTLKSTRMKTRLPRRSRSLIESFMSSAKASRYNSALRDNSVCLQPLRHQQPKQIDAAVRIPPLVVVPRQNLDEISVHHLRVRRVDDRRVRVALEIDRYELLGGVLEILLQRAFGGGLQRGVDFRRGRLLVDQCVEIDNRDVRRRDAHREAVELAFQI